MTPPSHLSDCLLLICQCVSLSLFIACVVGIASAFPSLLQGAKRALENYSVRILLSFAVTIALCFFWDELCFLSNYLFCLIGGHHATLFFLSLLVCFFLYWVDLRRKKGLRLAWFSLFPLFLFGIEWARLEGYYLVAVAAICFCGVLFMLSLLNSSFSPSHLEERKDVLLGRGYMYNRLFANIKNMMEDDECKAVAILGRWGEGKTHLLNDIIYRLSSERFLSNKDPKGTRHSVFRVCKINIWQYKTQEEAWEGVTDNIMFAVMGDDYKIRRTLFKLFCKLFPVAGFGRISQFASFLNILYNTTYGLDKEGANSEISLDELNSKLKGHKLVLVFDDLERADISIVRFLLPLIEKLKKIRNLFIICSIAPDELERVFVRNGYVPGEAHDYLIKIFDFFHRLPKAARPPVNEMGRSLLREREEREKRRRVKENPERENGEEKWKGELGEIYPLTKAFLFDFQDIIVFDTPRQLERTVDLLTNLEQCYFQDVKFEPQKNPYPTVFVTFFVEMLRTFYESVCTEAGDNNGFLDLLDNFPNCYIRKDFSIKGKKIVDINEWKKAYPHTSARCETDRLLRVILMGLVLYPDKGMIPLILDGSYARYVFMNEQTCLKFIENCKGKVDHSIKDMISEFLEPEGIMPENIELSVQLLVEYALMNSANSYSSEFIGSLFQFESENPKTDSEIFSLNVSLTCFLSIFRKYLETWRGEKDRFIHILKSTLELIYRGLELKNQWKLLSDLTIDEGEEYESSSGIYRATLDDESVIRRTISTVRLFSSMEAFSEVLTRLCDAFVTRFLETLNEGREIEKEFIDDVFKFMERRKDAPYYGGFSMGIERFRKETREFRGDFLKFLLEYLMAEKKGNGGETWAWVCMANWNILKSLVEVLSQDEKQLECMTEDYLEEKIRVCEFSVSGWGRKDPPDATFRDYALGAAEMKKVWQDLLEKKRKSAGNK